MSPKKRIPKCSSSRSMRVQSRAERKSRCIMSLRETNLSTGLPSGSSFPWNGNVRNDELARTTLKSFHKRRSECRTKNLPLAPDGAKASLGHCRPKPVRESITETRQNDEASDVSVQVSNQNAENTNQTCACRWPG